ncbi:MAG: relaxase/mobilization nuclease domain-containing protein [Treponemataceae bacterium]|nr:relaxase/mobilization nuclease domain-containing protein [Treponemataceae bacterium]
MALFPEEVWSNQFQWILKGRTWEKDSFKMRSKSIKNIFNRPPQKNVHSQEDLFKWKKPVYVKNDLEAFNKLFKGWSKRERQNAGSFSGLHSKAGHAFVFPEKNQRVTFKMSYSNSMSSHNKYINHYMPQENKDYVEEKPELFGMSQEEYDRHKVPLNFKFIISPENQNVDLTELTRSFIKRLEAQTGYALCWRAAIHKDTGHPHTHVVINGRDLNGRDIFFNKETVILMRSMCMNAATMMVGERTKEEIELSKKNEVSANRWTKTDLLLENFSSAKIAMDGLSPLLENRLSHLVSINMAKIDRESNSYVLSRNWKETLKAAGRYNTYLDEYVKSGEKLELYDGGKVSGVVEKVITFDKDEAWNDALIIRSGERRVYVPVWQLHKEDLKGKRVSIQDVGKNGEGKISRQVNDRNIFVRD